MNQYSDFFAFRKMITPLIIQVIFWIGVAVCIMSGLILIIEGASSSFGGGGTVLLGLLEILLGPLFVRIYCELVIVMFRIFDELKGIREVLTPPAQGIAAMPVQPAPPPQRS